MIYLLKSYEKLIQESKWKKLKRKKRNIENHFLVVVHNRDIYLYISNNKTKRKKRFPLIHKIPVLF
jgi:hypothetical protein